MADKGDLGKDYCQLNNRAHDVIESMQNAHGNLVDLRLEAARLGFDSMAEEIEAIAADLNDVLKNIYGHYRRPR